MDSILYPIMWVISWIMYGIHAILTTLGLPQGAGSAWVWSIIGLTVVVRILIIPLYNKQIRSTRAMQELQPEMQKIQKKYKGRKDQVSRQRQQEEMMALYRDHGSSPFASCFPLLIQMPIFFALVRMLYAIDPLSKGTYERAAIGPINETIAQQIGGSELFGAPLTSSIATSNLPIFAGMSTRITVVAVVMIALLVVTLFFQQKQMMTWNMPKHEPDPDNPMANQMQTMQKTMLYGMPLIYIFTGYAFQIGVLIYWVTGNFWNIGQQTWLMLTNPTPGSEAHKRKLARDRAKRIKAGLPPEEGTEENTGGQRVQPLGKNRSKKAGSNVDAFGNPLPDGAEDAAGEAQFNDAGEEIGKDGLTDSERAQKRYERRLAERQRSAEKKAARAKKAARNKKDRNF
ncbi:YidC/Oxa1 family membrane protein insertase [Arcanobacterium wilhelmae]|uniref:Membrane protein insertase YidC n=1 Tax=Arcanobacterium wilhelmae TaxID=1803177 RepID=A0ABT9NBM2_9ACTO|nr:membrane protein insertase YidC [Arcanobacterium wilhelmae]MDP9800913.1 YidC/Oxa1 family membrane protein insertase [Arcanobacterium wilhelmae]WFN90276.1 membrane protein insertase YidC [Arcanobacterium wilhelmae]